MMLSDKDLNLLHVIIYFFNVKQNIHFPLATNP